MNSQTMTDTKYTSEGQRCLVLAKLPSGKFLVAGQIGTGCDDDEPWFDTDHPAVVARVFDEAPVAVHEKRVAELLAEIESLEARASALSCDIYAAEISHKERLAKLSKYEPLARIEDFIDGKITHYVIAEGWDYRLQECGHVRLRISTPDAERCGNERSRPDLKLLCLFGSGRDLKWQLNRYSDGSNKEWGWCWPFTSIEEAQSFARKLFDEACEKCSKLSDNYGPHELNETAKALGLPAPEWIARRLASQELSSAKAEHEEATKKLAKANERLQAALQ